MAKITKNLGSPDFKQKFSQVLLVIEHKTLTHTRGRDRSIDQQNFKHFGRIFFLFEISTYIVHTIEIWSNSLF